MADTTLTLQATAAPTQTDDSNGVTGFDYFTTDQQVAIFAVGTVSSILSVLGSTTIIVLLLKAQKYKRELYHRLVAGLTVMDFILTASISFMPFAAPSETGLLKARGNFTTCTWTGFFFAFYLGGAIYNAFLSLYYCLMINHGWREEKIRKWMEPWVHILAFGAPTILSTTATVQEMINPSEIYGMCTYNAYPPACLKSEDVPCQRGRDSPLSRIIQTAYLIAAAAGIYYTIRVYVSVRQQTRSNLRFSRTGELDANQKRRIKAVGQQAVLYTLAFLNGFLTVLLHVVTDFFVYGDRDSSELRGKPIVFAVALILFFGFPLQGFWNFLVYIRPRLLQWKKANPNRSWWWAFQMVLTAQPVATIRKPGNYSQHTSTERTEGTSHHQIQTPMEEADEVFESPATVGGNSGVDPQEARGNNPDETTL